MAGEDGRRGRRPATARDRGPAATTHPAARLAARGGPTRRAAAAERATAAYFRRFAAGESARACALLTRGAIAAQVQDRRADRADCAVALRRTATPALRRQAGEARIGPATVRGSHAYVAVTAGAGPPAYVPLRELGGRWLVDGAAVR